MIKKYRAQLLIAGVVYTGLISFGYAATWTSAVFEKLSKNPNLLGYHTSATQLNWIVSAIFIGGIVGAIPLGPIANILGQKKTLMIAAALALICYVCMAQVKRPNALIVLRSAVGLTTFTILVLSLVYLGEIASTEIRGMILGASGIFLSAGMLVAFAYGPYVSYEAINYLGAAISLVYFVGLFFIPESPVFLIKKGRNEEAKRVLISLNRKEDAEKMSQMKLEAEITARNAKWTHLFTVKCNRKALAITCILYCLQEMSGIAPLLSYSTMIYEMAGSSITPHVATIITSIVQLLSGTLTPIFIERYGRRYLLLFSTFMTCLSLAVLSIYLNLNAYGNPIVKKIKWLPLLCSLMYFVTYSLGLGIIPATLVGEMFELHMRNAGTSAVLLVNYSTGFMMLHVFGYLLSGLGIQYMFIVFSVVCAVAFFFTLFFVPETKGKSLMEVQKMLS